MSTTPRQAFTLCLALILPGALLASDPPARSADTHAASTAMPTRGMTTDQVLQRFGTPLRRVAPVGEPPITRWQYDGMTVYFEGRHVIHSVATTSTPE